MPNAFDAARGIEKRGRDILAPYFEERTAGLVFTDKGKLARFIQEHAGDFLFNDKRHKTMYAAEMKIEQKHTGNLFLETWSNRNLEDKQRHADLGSNVGWLAKCRADFLVYYFLDSDDLYVIDLFGLQRWAFGYAKPETADGKPMPGRIYQYWEVRQKAYNQLNDTWGRLVPVEDLMAQRVPLWQGRVKQLNIFAELALARATNV